MPHVREPIKGALQPYWMDVNRVGRAADDAGARLSPSYGRRLRPIWQDVRYVLRFGAWSSEFVPTGHLVHRYESSSNPEGWLHARLPSWIGLSQFVKLGAGDPPDDEIVELTGALSNDFELRKPVTVHVFLENDEFVADAEELHIYSFGGTRDEALANLRERIVQQYKTLQEQEGRLAPPMRDVAQTLHAAVQPSHA